MIEVPATAITDPGWLSEQLSLSAKRYPLGDRVTLGVLWWYSASSVLFGAVVEARDPALEAVTLLLERDGRVREARSPVFDGDLPARTHEMLTSAISSIATVSGARERQLWAIAADSLATRMLWAGKTSQAPDLAAAIGPELPAPRYVEVRGREFVRRVSCCLIYLGTSEQKCTSCPRQKPSERLDRLSRLVG
ncbi:(2Fe-2S)-binding protein [Kibdelosporangium persicum]|uniref:Ferric iron reductase protein FhuF, involved in iron transport n=1 Tax=Kibdelosporangium persicum TaxID=2698649 RepID=A0ABX2FD80_9PSEU|nr:(2Fe-2S)-binding protein [Kibdelosporangium persicum]NRN69326.1 Ferric iron reductase protein FhuF, involved in iron transport [Kibdelosporangium persicum]